MMDTESHIRKKLKNIINRGKWDIKFYLNIKLYSYIMLYVVW